MKRTIAFALPILLLAPATHAQNESEFSNQFTLQADGLLHEAQFDCASVTEEAFAQWQVDEQSDAAYDATIASDGKGAALIMYEMAKSKFDRLYAADPKQACSIANQIMDRSIEVPSIDAPAAPSNDEDTSAKFYQLGMIDKLYEDCQGMVELRHWSAALALPSGNFAEGLILYSVGRDDAEVSAQSCAALAQYVNN